MDLRDREAARERPDHADAQQNRQMDGFDAEGLAGQLEQVGASYFVITLGQGSGHYCAPNATYDALTGVTPSKCSRRDLVAALYDALHPRGIRLMQPMAQFEKHCNQDLYIGCTADDDGQQVGACFN